MNSMNIHQYIKSYMKINYTNILSSKSKEN